MDKMYKEGGLATDGTDVDPISGNEVPTGSNAVEVRDDVDAKLSEGEYVVPADVVKFMGVSTLEKMVKKAKEGLQEMEENGRIGGAPAEVKEEVMEYSLGSDIDDLDGYAAGGLVDGKDYGAIIDRVKDAALKDPTISNMLKSKGIFLEGGNQGKPLAMAEGGMVGEYDPANYMSNFNPYAHTPGFSGTAAAPTGGMVAPKPQPVTCPPGFMYDAATNSCVVDPNAQKPQQSSGGGGGSSYTPAPQTSWMDKYDYTNPETLMKQTMTTLGGGEQEESEGLLGGVKDLAKGALGRSPIGRLMSGQNYAEAMANAAVLESHGHVAEAQAIREAAGSFAEASGVRVGGLLDGTERMTNAALSAHGKNTMGQTTAGGGARTGGGTSSAAPSSRLDSKGATPKTVTGSTPRSRKGDDDNRVDFGSSTRPVSRADTTKSSSGSGGSDYGRSGAGNVSSKGKSEKTRGSSGSGSSYGRSGAGNVSSSSNQKTKNKSRSNRSEEEGLYKGGLVAKRTTYNKKNTKKGLGQR